MSKFAGPIAGAALIALVASVTLARADDQKIPPEKLPAAITKAVKARFPRAEITSGSKEVEDGKTTFEVELKSEGAEYSVSLKEDGTITEIEKEIEPADLPAAVLKAVKEKYPTGTLKEAEEVTAGAKTTFEVMVSVPGKKKMREIALDKEGKILSDEEEDED